MMNCWKREKKLMLNSEFIMLNFRSWHAEETDFRRNPKKLPKEKSNGYKKLNSNRKKKKSNITTLDEILDTKNGEKGEEKKRTVGTGI